jgi:hypothetical protein
MTVYADLLTTTLQQSGDEESTEQGANAAAIGNSKASCGSSAKNARVRPVGVHSVPPLDRQAASAVKKWQIG